MGLAPRSFYFEMGKLWGPYSFCSNVVYYVKCITWSYVGFWFVTALLCIDVVDFFSKIYFYSYGMYHNFFQHEQQHTSPCQELWFTNIYKWSHIKFYIWNRWVHILRGIGFFFRGSQAPPSQFHVRCIYIHPLLNWYLCSEIAVLWGLVDLFTYYGTYADCIFLQYYIHSCIC